MYNPIEYEFTIDPSGLDSDKINLENTEDELQLRTTIDEEHAKTIMKNTEIDIYYKSPYTGIKKKITTLALPTR